ncbi:assimilatory sulfite reductase (NADPH) flavoprotein subunit [Paenibacillus albiflavus]|uniref:assimilatory sulfite reductase (NADPH) n=1 Tax=Paenibacillus albiflavus TaxID=2545760 RepID=A0A4R4EFT9_9BACL|nr:assimilatory sulfite reductase (NADPH) flavoprotein subunit [Paenibacillus albiflavus]TCZ78143.1 assimilatory sulfite reductase (NADPH) flavoprotein subunit [Paenibacillus albiflavus]
MQFTVVNSPFNQEQVDLLNRLLPALSEGQKAWLSGYLAAAQFAGLESAIPQIAKEITIIYGSQTGNAQGLAKQFGKVLVGDGYHVNISSMNDVKPNNLKKIQNLLIITSTHGEGEPPDNALSFHEFLHGKRAPRLDDLHFSVLSLGDSSYEFFCQTGKEFDVRLEELGGKRLYARVDCDLDYDDPASEWIAGVRLSLKENDSEYAVHTAAATAEVIDVAYSRTSPYQAEVLENINLNGRGSNKETRHLELLLEGSGLTYEPGDSIGIYPKNNPVLVEQLIEELIWDPEALVTVNKDGDVLPFREALFSYYEITVLTKQLLEKIAQLSENANLRELVSSPNSAELKEYLGGRDLLDLVRDYGPWGKSAQEFVSVLRKIPARLYSIASSSLANPEEVHLTIGTVRYDAHGREREGVCSTYCADRVQLGDTLNIYIQHNENFKLPSNPNTPIIMIGPGTGVAPFRAFMQEREELGAKGKSWLFFGDRHFVTDFLYQIEWQKLLKSGVLTKMDIAFSRDTEKKVYVQHRMLEHSKELFEWLEEGAVVYICGDEKNMARDVHSALIDIIEREGGMSREEAAGYLTSMQQHKRYQRDVY